MKWLIVGAMLIAQACCWLAAQAAERPNVLILMADNWAYPHAGVLGDRVVKTPTFDRLARDGTLFRHAFCLAPSCAPARAAFLTGQTIHRLDDAANLHGRFPARHRVFTEALEAAGYFVGHSGKGWGPGNIVESGRTRNPAGAKFEDAAAFLQELPRDKPFCYWFSSKHPHIPWSEGAEQKAAMNRAHVRVPKYLPDVPEVRDNIGDYLCEVQLFDQQCDTILKAFQDAGRLDNTLIVMTGDNGWQMPHGLAHIYDSGTRVPLAICWHREATTKHSNQPEDNTTPLSVRDDFVNFDDFAPTFLEVAGLKPFEECTGRSLLPLIKGALVKDSEASSTRDAVFLARERHANVRRGDRSYPVRAIRTQDFLYVRNFEPDLWPAGDPQVYFAVGDFGDVDFTLTKQFILDRRDDPAMKPFFDMNFGKRPAEELYDLRADPDQTRNIAASPEYAASKRALSERLTNWMRETHDPRFTNPHDERWDKATYYGGPAKPQVGRVTRTPFKIFDGQPTQLYFTGNSHHPTYGQDKLASLLDRYFKGHSPIVVDGLEDARKDPITQQPIKPAKLDELMRFLEPVFTERDRSPEPRARLIVLNFVIVESPRSKPRPDWIKEDADALQRYCETALKRGASAVFLSEMVQPNFIQGGKSGNRFRRAGLQVFDEIANRKLQGVFRGPTLQVLMEDKRHLFNDDRHFGPRGRDYIAYCWLETLLQHDGLPIPDWCRDEMKALAAEPTAK